MIWAFIIALPLAVFAGAGAKWAVDRIWPPLAVAQAQELGYREGWRARDRQRAPRLTAYEDTMDVLGAGVDVGLRMGRHARPFHNDDALGHVSGSGPMPQSFVYRDDPAVPAELLTAEYANNQHPTGGSA